MKAHFGFRILILVTILGGSLFGTTAFGATAERQQAQAKLLDHAEASNKAALRHTSSMVFLCQFLCNFGCWTDR